MAKYIEREALMRDARRTCAIVCGMADIFDIECLVYDQPACDVVKVQHGEWEPIVDLKTSKYRYQHTCGACGKSIFDDNKFNYPHCPNCGAKMDGKGGG